MKKVLFTVPVGDRKIYADVVLRIMKLKDELLKDDIHLELVTAGESLIPRLRDLLGHIYKQGDWDVWVTCDNDIIFPIKRAIRNIKFVIENSNNVIVHPCPINPRHATNAPIPNISWPMGEASTMDFAPIEHGGTGFMIIGRGIFNKIINSPNTKFYKSDVIGGGYGEEIKQIFPVEIEEDRLLGEDWGFCHLANRTEQSVWADMSPEAWCKHIVLKVIQFDEEELPTPEEETSKPTFFCPDDMVQDSAKVWEGIYDPGIRTHGLEKGDETKLGLSIHTGPFKILDIGACVGAFMVWAFRKWPTATIESVEPNPVAFEYLKQNANECLKGIPLPPRLTVHNMAIHSDSTRDRLYMGKNNLGEASLYKRPGHNVATVGDRVKLIDPKILPPCNFIKVDTEGSEIDILTHYPHLRDCLAVAYEYHSVEDRDTLANLMIESGFKQHSHVQESTYSGVSVWVK